jgi:hypothetical protein
MIYYDSYSSHSLSRHGTKNKKVLLVYKKIIEEPFPGNFASGTKMKNYYLSAIHANQDTLRQDDLF